MSIYRLWDPRWILEPIRHGIRGTTTFPIHRGLTLIVSEAAAPSLVLELCIRGIQNAPPSPRTRGGFESIWRHLVANGVPACDWLRFSICLEKAHQSEKELIKASLSGKCEQQLGHLGTINFSLFENTSRILSFFLSFFQSSDPGRWVRVEITARVTFSFAPWNEGVNLGVGSRETQKRRRLEGFFLRISVVKGSTRKMAQGNVRSGKGI